MKKLEHQISNEDFFASMDEIKSYVFTFLKYIIEL